MEAATLPSASDMSLADDGPSELTQSSGRDVLLPGAILKSLQLPLETLPKSCSPFAEAEAASLRFRHPQVNLVSKAVN